MTTVPLPPLTGSALFDPWRLRYRERLAAQGVQPPVRQPTRSEVVLWEALQRSRWTWAAEHPTRYGYTLDFFCADLRLAVEVDGPSHWGAAKAERDAWRDVVHQRLGILTRRFSARHVEDDVDGVLEQIDALCASRLAELEVGGGAQRIAAAPPRPTGASRPSPPAADAGPGDAKASPRPTDRCPGEDDGWADLDGDERLLAFPPEPPGWSTLLPACRTVLPAVTERASLLARLGARWT